MVWVLLVTVIVAWAPAVLTEIPAPAKFNDDALPCEDPLLNIAIGEGIPSPLRRTPVPLTCTLEKKFLTPDTFWFPVVLTVVLRSPLNNTSTPLTVGV